MLDTVVSSRRFASVPLLHFCIYVSEGIVAQFAACTFSIADARGERLCIAYRETDVHQVGWNEDFILSVMEAVPSELLATTYLESVSVVHPHARLTLAGHSKGGTLAEYAALQAGGLHGGLVEHVITFDAPGVHKVASSACPELAAEDTRIARLQDSVTFELRNPDVMRMVEATGITDGHGVFVPRVEGAVIPSHALTERELHQGSWLNRWVGLLSLEERQAVIDCVFARYRQNAAGFLVRGLDDVPRMLYAVLSSYFFLLGATKSRYWGFLVAPSRI